MGNSSVPPRSKQSGRATLRGYPSEDRPYPGDPGPEDAHWTCHRGTPDGRRGPSRRRGNGCAIGPQAALGYNPEASRLIIAASFLRVSHCLDHLGPAWEH